jgi:hypothetical protein
MQILALSNAIEITCKRRNKPGTFDQKSIQTSRTISQRRNRLRRLSSSSNR